MMGKLQELMVTTWTKRSMHVVKAFLQWNCWLLGWSPWLGCCDSLPYELPKGLGTAKKFKEERVELEGTLTGIPAQVKCGSLQHFLLGGRAHRKINGQLIYRLAIRFTRTLDRIQGESLKFFLHLMLGLQEETMPRYHFAAKETSYSSTMPAVFAWIQLIGKMHVWVPTSTLPPLLLHHKNLHI